MNKNQIKAFSLVEVLIFVVIFSLFFVVAASVVISSLRVTTTNQNKIKATHFNDELSEWLRSEKEINWGGLLYTPPQSADSFTEQATIEYPNTSFCFNTTPIVKWETSGSFSCDFSLDNHFRRIATFSAVLAPTIAPVSPNYANQIKATITTEWMEGASVRSSVVNKLFSIWE